MKKIPYGISNFRDVRLQDYIYVDKTKYIEILESYGEKYIFFLRPRRFGKSLFLSLLESYYDLKEKDDFERLFGGLYIGKHPTPLLNSYYILKFNFSGINTSSQKRLVADFKLVVLEALHQFCERYDLDFDYTKVGLPSVILRSFLNRFESKVQGKMYVLIDEYDHFANELLSFQTEVFEETISKTGFVRKWYEVLKNGTAMGVIDRIFVTGVSPVTLDSLTSGFNIASNLTRDGQLNEMMGFTEDEVIGLLQDTVNLPDVQQLIPELKSYYNGYLFNEDLEQRVFNSDMILYYLNTYQRSNRPPKDLIDTNISSDYSKMQKLFTLKNQERNYRILERILNDEPQLTTITREYSLAKEFTEEDFLSLLFYLGFLTIDSPVLDMVYLKVPNYAIKELYFSFFTQIIKEYTDYELETIQIKKSIVEIGTKGKMDEFLTLVEQVLEALSNRDFIKFDEKYIKFVILTYLGLSKTYHLKSEYEANGGYVDIAFFNRTDNPEIYEGLIELKYIKKKDYEDQGSSLVQEKLAEAKQQLLSYSQAPELKERKKLLKWVFIFVGSKCVERVGID